MLLNPWHRFARIALVSLSLCLVVVAACTTETVTDVEVGKRVQMELGNEAGAQAEDGEAVFIFKYVSPDDVTREAKKLSDVLIIQPGVSDASVSISQQSNGEILTHGSILLWFKQSAGRNPRWQKGSHGPLPWSADGPLP